MNIAKRRKGLSPVIATVLLIGIVIALALIIFLWFRGTMEPAITKFDKNIELVCQEDVDFDASYSSTGGLQIVNSGKSPIFSFKVRIIREDGEYETKDIGDIATDSWPGDGLKQSGSFSSAISGTTNGDKLLLIPVLLGSSEEGDVAFTCKEETGVKVNLA